MKTGCILLFRIIAIGAVSFLTGCVAPQQQKVILWNRDSNESIVAFQKPVVPENDLNYSLLELVRAQLFFENGDYFHSDRRFANATRVMSRIKEGGGQETTAVVIDERVKTFKGEPYERATAFFYRGLCQFNMGKYEGALAAFRNSLASDEETRNPDNRFLQDFTIAQFMAALCYDRLGDADNARAALDLAKTNAPNNPYLSTANLKHNFIAIIGVGEGPFKLAARKWVVGLSPEKRIELVIDEGQPSQPGEVTDLLFQAKSQKRGAADNARVARKTGKFILSVFLSAATGVNINIEDYDDVRSWHGLPWRFYLFTADLPPGTHNVTLKTYDEKGKELERHRQVWFDVPVQAQAGPVLYLRTKRNWQNEHGLQQVKLIPSAESASQ